MTRAERFRMVRDQLETKGLSVKEMARLRYEKVAPKVTVWDYVEMRRDVGEVELSDGKWQLKEDMPFRRKACAVDKCRGEAVSVRDVGQGIVIPVCAAHQQKGSTAILEPLRRR